MIEALALGADPASWSEAGFSVEGNAATVGSVQLAFTSGEGIVGWRLAIGEAEEIDGLPVAPPMAAGRIDPDHPNGVTQIDHIVVLTPDLERTTTAFGKIGTDRRRVREMDIGDGSARQGFFRLGEVILEVVEHPRVEPGVAQFWGVTFTVADLDAAAELLGDRLGTVRDAVQPGRRIATVRGSAGLGLPVALISAAES